jgi:hypothetical protein
MITTQMTITRTWALRTPQLFRYMKQKHIDDFFNTGRIRLSTFQQFRKHRDEQRRDTEEGKVPVVKRGHTCTAFARFEAPNSLILSTSTIGDKGLMITFDVTIAHSEH